MADSAQPTSLLGGLGTLFGFTLPGKKKKPIEQPKTFEIPREDGALVVQSGSYYGTYIDLDGAVRNENELISKYREISIQPELEGAIEDIVNEAIITDKHGKCVDINLDDLNKTSNNVKKAITEEFNNILRLLNFGNNGHEIFRRWYIDGRLFYHIILDDENKSNGIKELRYIDPRKITKVKEVRKSLDPRTGIEVIESINEFYVYNEIGINLSSNTLSAMTPRGIKILPDAIAYITSGLLDAQRIMVLSYLHKAIKPLNNLRMVEDATVIYRLSRAPERRIFYVDTGNMPAIKSEEYLKEVATKYRNKLVYDATTGEIRDDRKYTAMIEDIWLARREGSKGTEIGTLPGGQNLGKIEDVEYFEKKLYKSLGIPFSRSQEGTAGLSFGSGESQSITRDEMKFSKFIQKLRNKFASIIDDLMKVQLVLKNICTEEEWKEWKEFISYDFQEDNHWEELKTSQITQSRMTTLNLVQPYVGQYYSMEWVRKEILKMSDEEIEEIEKQIEEEIAAGKVISPVETQKQELEKGKQEMDQGKQQFTMDKQKSKMETDQAKDEAEAGNENVLAIKGKFPGK